MGKYIFGLYVVDFKKSWGTTFLKRKSTSSRLSSNFPSGHHSREILTKLISGIILLFFCVSNVNISLISLETERSRFSSCLQIFRNYSMRIFIVTRIILKFVPLWWKRFPPPQNKPRTSKLDQFCCANQPPSRSSHNVNMWLREDLGYS